MYRFDDFHFDPPTGGLSQSGTPIALEPQAIRLLEVLIRDRDRVVSKEDLIEEIWDGRAITDAALNTRIRSVRRALGDDATTSKYIKTFPKRGFQFVAELSTGDAAGEALPKKPKRHLVFATLGLVVALVLISLTLTINKPAELLTEKPSLAVVQFENLDGASSAQYFADGLTDDLIAHLSRHRELFVVSRATMFSYAGEDVTDIEIARDLGVGYLVRGSVRRNGKTVRISGELIDVNARKTVWAETFDRDQTDIFAVQDEISQAIAGRLLPEIYATDAERIADKPTGNMDAWDLYLRGRHSQAIYSKDAQKDAVRFAQQAIDRDPDFATAYSLLARALGTLFFFQWTDNQHDTLVSATEAAKRAIELDDQDAQAHAALGYLNRFTGDADPAIANLERAVSLNPNDARIRLELAHTLDWFRFQDRALPQIDMALSLSPRDPLLQNMYFYKGHILFHLGRHEDALEAARQLGAVATSNTWRVFHHLLRAANLIELDRPQDAMDAIRAALAINPKLSVSAMQRQFVGSRNHPENRRIWLESLQKAGLPLQ
ncbi:winged helix-turn-helix domain-containing tetratricopeptide repeat protein [Litoreibacter halocynthiae]|uniref:winged helix-turn-helix domain-containing tetratricopeptide repeat protein n=1 Tax=Litoreibacter halocynthiae TaxID=1242689 RepID=UPI00248F6484|nr:winged helix-turn-helix domain-containing protein [Litoreibacter halocynthiae]